MLSTRYVSTGYIGMVGYVGIRYVYYVSTGMWHKISIHRRAYILVVLKFGGPPGPTKGVQGAKPPASCESVP